MLLTTLSRPSPRRRLLGHRPLAAALAARPSPARLPPSCQPPTPAFVRLCALLTGCASRAPCLYSLRRAGARPLTDHRRMTHGDNGILCNPVSTAPLRPPRSLPIATHPAQAAFGSVRTTPPHKRLPTRAAIWYANVAFARARGAWACSAAGRASAWHAEGRGFESPQVHPFWQISCSGVAAFRPNG